MIWRRGRPRRSQARATTPADLADIAAARAQLRRLEQATAASRSRWPIVLEIKSYLRRVHEENHLADDLRLIFSARDHRG